MRGDVGPAKNVEMLHRTVVSVSSCEQVPRHQAGQTLCWLAWVREWCSFVLWGGWVGYYVTGGPHMRSDKQLPSLCYSLLAGSARLFFEENPAFHVNAIEVCWPCGALIFRNEVQQATAWTCQEYPFQSGVSPHPFHCFIIAV